MPRPARGSYVERREHESLNDLTKPGESSAKTTNPTMAEGEDKDLVAEASAIHNVNDVVD